MTSLEERVTPPRIGPDGLPVGGDGTLINFICFSDYCGDSYGYYLEAVIPLLIVIVAAFVARRWSELLMVAAAGLAASLIVSIIGGRIRLAGGLPALDFILSYYLLFLGAAAIGHGVKRAVQMLFVRRLPVA